MREIPTHPQTPAEIDEQIIRLAGQQGALDEEIGRWLLLAHEARLHRHFGMASFAEYVERRLGYRARVAKDKAIVAEALEQLPVLRQALITGHRSWSATRELVRVATRGTEVEWLRASEAKTVREVEHLVSGRRLGDLPTAEKDPLLAIHRSVYNQTSDQHAITQDAKLRARRILGPHATDGECLAFICESFLGRAQQPDDQPAYQVAVTICPGCSGTFRPVAGELIEVPEAVHDCAVCDGELVGLVPASTAAPQTHVGEFPAPCSPAPSPQGDEPPTFDTEAATHVGQIDATTTHHTIRELIRTEGLGAVYRVASTALGFSLQTVTKSLRRSCLARDNYACTVPGCRNALFIDLHHLIKESEGGANGPENLTTLCSAHHRQHHAGYLGIEGTPSTGLIFSTMRGTLYGHIPKRAAA